MTSLIIPPSVAALAEFSGRDVVTFTAFATEALAQAALLFQISTCLEQLPDQIANTINYNMAINGILALGDRLYLEQPYDEVSAKPFVAEHIGMYSYSRSSYGSKLLIGLQAGQPTGIFWFDLAVERLGVCNTAAKGASGGIDIDISGRESVLCRITTSNPNDVRYHLLGPEELNTIDFPMSGVNLTVPAWWIPSWWKWDQ